MRQGRPRQVSLERRSHQNLLEFQTGSHIQQPRSSPATSSFSDIEYGTIATHSMNTCVSHVPTDVQSTDSVDLLPLNNMETSRSAIDPLSNVGSPNDVLVDFDHFNPPLSAPTVLYDGNLMSTQGWVASGDDEGKHQQWYNNSALTSMLPYNESVPGPGISGLAASTPVSVDEKLSNYHEPSQFACPLQSAETPNTFNLPMEHTANHWICGCSAMIASLLEQLTPHGIVGVTRARDNALLCNLDAIILRNEEPLRKVNGVLQCPCSLSVSILLHLGAVMLKILGWYTAIIGMVMRCVASVQTAPEGSRNSFMWVSEFFEPYDAGIGSAEQARGYLQLVSSKFETIRPVMSTLTARLLVPGKQPAFGRSSLSHRLEDTSRTLLRAGGLCGTLSCKSIAHAFAAEMRSRFEGSWQSLVDALHSL